MLKPWIRDLSSIDFGFCYQGAAKVLIFPVVQQFTEAFVQALQIPDGPTSDSGFKMEVLKVNTYYQWNIWCLRGWSEIIYFLYITHNLSPFLFLGSDSPSEKLPKAHGVLHAADSAYCLEHPNRECSFISFLESLRELLPPIVRNLALGLTFIWFHSSYTGFFKVSTFSVGICNVSL